jgi:hypothetical protein
MKPTKAQQLTGTIGKTARQVELIDQACGFYFPRHEEVLFKRTLIGRLRWLLTGK